MIEVLVVVLLVFLDQMVKILVRANIPLGGEVPLLPNVLGLTHIRNEGAAFSSFVGARWFFVVLTVAFLVFAFWLLFAKKIRRPLGRWALVVVIGGAIGNLIDRVLYGYVVDMFEVQFMNFAIFNVADIFVVVGGIALCVYLLFFHEKKDGEKDGTHHPDL